MQECATTSIAFRLTLQAPQTYKVSTAFGIFSPLVYLPE